MQSELISIPGHAEHFRNEIERERATLNPDAYRGNYDRNRRLAFETLSHLPSPETIKVLGGYLDDERDAAKEFVWDGVLLGMDPNSKCALDALRSIGLRSPGFEEPDAGKWPEAENYATHEEARRAVFDYLVARNEMHLKPWRTWFSEVKSGKRSFSLKGQAVEYRFKSDGAWETIPIANPPDDAPAIPEAPAREKPVSRPPPAQEVENLEPVGNSWAWIVGAVIAALGGLVWFGARKVKGNG